MSRDYFQARETQGQGCNWPLQEVLAQLNFDAQGLIPVIAQQYDTGKVLMMAWMNAQAVQQTLTSGRVTYWSRSRQAFWIKGQTSGHTQRLTEMRIDCDGDAILCLVDQTGGACHTLRSSCFYLTVDTQNQTVLVNENIPTSLD